jgi:non-ribosomal peptide synthetase component E (peptide arylation enzyme)
LEYFWQLESFNENVAFIDESGVPWTYGQVAVEADLRVRDAALLVTGVSRPVVIIETTNTISAILAYVGALRANWVIMLSNHGSTDQDRRIIDTYQPNLIFRQGWTKHSSVPVPTHPDLTVLLSTSGTTGSPKLVRLSKRNIQCNANSICEYLVITGKSRAITTLDFSYSYGMSVINSHLNVGASIILTSCSLLEDRFWALAKSHSATSMALVPFQFDLLDRTGFSEMTLPSLATITQAGGRLAATTLERYYKLGQKQGWRLIVMYGQTEASPRIAYVPADMLMSNLESIGIAVPGGHLTIRDDDGKVLDFHSGKVGELVYEGPNVMMGYAIHTDDLLLPQGSSLLATGDNAVRQANGIFKIVGRKSRFLKLFGLRVNLDDIEGSLQQRGVTAICTGSDSRLEVFVVGETSEVDVGRHIQDRYQLPPRSFKIHDMASIDEVPRLANGKTDYRQLSHLAQSVEAAETPSQSSLYNAIARSLNISEVKPELSFAEHGGDSLAFIDAELSLAQLLGHLPEKWETMKLAQLTLVAQQARPVTELLRIDILWRVAALASVIALHATTLPVAGGASLLILFIGYSLANFQMRNLSEGNFLALVRANLLQILLGYYLVLFSVVLFWKPIGWSWFALLGNFEKTFEPHGIEPYWFVCFYVQVLLAVFAATLLPAVRQQIARRPIVSGYALVLTICLVQFGLTGHVNSNPLNIRNPVLGLQLIALGWCVALSEDTRSKAITAVLSVTIIIMFWNSTSLLMAYLILGILTLLYVPAIRLPTPIATVLRHISAASIFIYLFHPVVIHLISSVIKASPATFLLICLAASFALGIAVKKALAFAKIDHHLLRSVKKNARGSAVERV